jgi:hypothetical protein
LSDQSKNKVHSLEFSRLFSRLLASYISTSAMF